GFTRDRPSSKEKVPSPNSTTSPGWALIRASWASYCTFGPGWILKTWPAGGGMVTEPVRPQPDARPARLRIRAMCHARMRTPPQRESRRPERTKARQNEREQQQGARVPASDASVVGLDLLLAVFRAFALSGFRDRSFHRFSSGASSSRLSFS